MADSRIGQLTIRIQELSLFSSEYECGHAVHHEEWIGRHLNMITIEQMNFAGDLSNSADAFGVRNYFLEMIAAIEEGNVADLAKFSACAIIELAQHGFIIADKASRWIQLFGKLPEFEIV